MSKEEKGFTKENLVLYLKEVAKEFRRLNGKNMKAEIILVGGAAILANYGFRNMTTDIDAMIFASSAMREAINRVRDKYDLPKEWLNADFMKTDSYSPKLVEYSIYYRTFSNVLTIRIVEAEYLIAMKLRSARKYKHDISDIVGILSEHEEKRCPISMEKIEKAIHDLYGGWKGFPEDSKELIENIFAEGDYSNRYEIATYEEIHTKRMLLQFQEEYPEALKKDNINDIIKNLKNRKNN